MPKPKKGLELPTGFTKKAIKKRKKRNAKRKKKGSWVA
jgi:hypothetical protein